MLKELDLAAARSPVPPERPHAAPAWRGEVVALTSARALLQHGVALDVSCEAEAWEAGRTRCLDGEPKHRDLVLGPHERARCIVPCVSGCLGNDLALDLLPTPPGRYL